MDDWGKGKGWKGKDPFAFPDMGELKRVEMGGEQAVAELCKELDSYTGPILLSKEEWEAGAALCSSQAKHDIEYAHANVKAFAEKQLESIHEFEVELSPGIF